MSEAQMILGIGTDIIEIARFTKEHIPRFMDRVFTAQEQQYLQNKGAASMAGLFAAKEAIVKALGTGFSGFWPCDAEIMHDSAGKPYGVLHGKAAKLAKEQVRRCRCKKKPRRLRYRRGYSIHVSISHSNEMAAATAIVLANRLH